MSGRTPITADGYERLKKELKELTSVERPAVIEAIAVAREHGDLKENAEYHAAREKQGFIEGRIGQLEDIKARADVIDITNLSGDTVKFGASVTVADDDNNESVYKIVGEYESNLDAGLISIQSPLAKALIGKGVEDYVEVKTPKGVKGYEIVKVEFS